MDLGQIRLKPAWYVGLFQVCLPSLSLLMRNPGEFRKTLQYRKFRSLAAPQDLGVDSVLTTI